MIQYDYHVKAYWAWRLQQIFHGNRIVRVRAL
jgi:hypothetical protein